MIYEPREDSLFLNKFVKKYARGFVLDMGTGSGIQAVTAAKKARKVEAVDINRKAIDYCKEHHKIKKILFYYSDLFSNIKGKFDVIIFNPPYLPEDIKLKDLTVDGGKKGYEIIESFLNQANDYLKTNGFILLLFSSLTDKEKVHEFLQNNLFSYKLLGEKGMFFERLYVYKIEKNSILKQLEKMEISKIHYFTKGHRGLLFTGFLKNRKITIKIKRPESKAIGRIRNEAESLKLINKKYIGPELIFSTNDYFVYEFVEGDFIINYFEKHNKKRNLNVIKDVFRQCFILDKLGYDKEEMHHPVKHIVIKQKPVLLDFERMHKTKKPKNVTQFCQFIGSRYITKLLKSKRINVDKKKIIKLAGEYKHNICENNLKRILDLIK